MSDTLPTMSTNSSSPATVVSSSLPPMPYVAMTTGTSVPPFAYIERYLSNRPLRVRVMDDPSVSERVNRLADQWAKERQRGVDVEQMSDTPAYREIIDIGYRAIRPILLMLLKRPDHWFNALHAITDENPVPPESEGRLVEMAGAWIKWGKQRGYIRDLD
jgi:hypothetical protein